MQKASIDTWVLRLITSHLYYTYCFIFFIYLYKPRVKPQTNSVVSVPVNIKQDEITSKNISKLISVTFCARREP